MRNDNGLTYPEWLRGAGYTEQPTIGERELLREAWKRNEDTSDHRRDQALTIAAPILTNDDLLNKVQSVH